MRNFIFFFLKEGLQILTSFRPHTIWIRPCPEKCGMEGNLWQQGICKLRVYREAAWHSESKERRVKVCTLRQEIRHW